MFIGPLMGVWAFEAAFGRFLASKGLVRSNYAGHPIPTSYGLLLFLAVMPFYLLALLLPGLSAYLLQYLIVALAFTLLGFADDRWGDRSVGGLKGHFRKLLRERELTTGATKALVGSWVALIVAATLIPGSIGKLILDAVLIALAANALNLVDTRPARSVVLFLIGTLLAGWLLSRSYTGTPPILWALPGASLAYLPVERSRRGMLGDSGSNLLGGTLGLSLVLALGFWGKLLAVAALVAFHVFTERRSLNAYIKERPLLRKLDEWIAG
jgi:UDP-N-acetylmuramyl pentapeptide phosphotransferase/UDP-N-acetylglucosamine-1-phosphate transferase